MEVDSEGSMAEEEEEGDCFYMGTDHLSVKIWLIGVFAVSICILSVLLNTFFSIVFWRSPQIRKTPVYYFGILAFIDILMAINYVMVIAVPVYFDYYESLSMYHLFLSYFRVMLTETAMAMFASMLLILLATTERLLRTFHSRNIIKVRKNVMADQFNVLSMFMQHAQAPLYVRKIRTVRKFLEKNRPLVCVVCVSLAIVYKVCHYFEVQYVEKENCTDFAHYEIAITEFSADPTYRFWWMFVTRNVVDRISPFFGLVIMNALIIKALKKEYKKLAAEPKTSLSDVNGATRTANPSAKPSRSSLRDATRALIGVVTTYLMSQCLQVLLTFWEALDKKTLETEYLNLYSYLNDIVSILPLIASCLRYPIYCFCNKDVYNSSLTTLKDIKNCMQLKRGYYFPIGKNHAGREATPNVVTITPNLMTNNNGIESEEPGTGRAFLAEFDSSFDALSDDSEHEWQL